MQRTALSSTSLRTSCAGLVTGGLDVCCSPCTLHAHTHGIWQFAAYVSTRPEAHVASGNSSHLHHLYWVLSAGTDGWSVVSGQVGAPRVSVLRVSQFHTRATARHLAGRGAPQGALEGGVAAQLRAPRRLLRRPPRLGGRQHLRHRVGAVRQSPRQVPPLLRLARAARMRRSSIVVHGPSQSARAHLSCVQRPTS